MAKCTDILTWIIKILITGINNSIIEKHNYLRSYRLTIYH